MAAAPTAAKVPTAARPALWAVSDRDTTVYLFGTIHLLPPAMTWRSPVFDGAVASADQLVVETIVDEKDPSRVMAAISSLAFTAGLPPLTERVPPAKRAALDAAVKRSGFPAKSLDGMETWAAAILLLGGQFKDLGVEISAGVETVLRGEFGAKGKAIGELETNVEQFGYFDRLPESAQRALLEGATEQGKSVQDVFDNMLSAWAAGDVKTIAKAFNQDLADSPELGKHIIVERNTHWANWVGERLGKPGTVLVAVGAGHLAGRGSVIEQLQKRGLKVRRIQ
ncbi:MAG: TraB/GumN family protein [Sphingomicrobium sp.]